MHHVTTSHSHFPPSLPPPPRRRPLPMLARLFNVKSTFDENLYTTPLDMGSLSREQMAHAERMAAEIEGKTSSNIHMREERNMVRRHVFFKKSQQHGRSC